jgi:hypothetical protein
MTDENRSVGQPSTRLSSSQAAAARNQQLETWHLNPETSEPRTLNPGTEPLNL